MNFLSGTATFSLSLVYIENFTHSSTWQLILFIFLSPRRCSFSWSSYIQGFQSVSAKRLHCITNFSAVLQFDASHSLFLTQFSSSSWRFPHSVLVLASSPFLSPNPHAFKGFHTPFPPLHFLPVNSKSCTFWAVSPSGSSYSSILPHYFTDFHACASF